MGTGKLSDDVLAFLLREVEAVPGDLAEVGVWQGRTFRRLVRAAVDRECVAHGFDSFHGMAEPGPYDDPSYRAGRFGVGGMGAFVAKHLRHVERDVPDRFRLWEGFIPDCFAAFELSSECGARRFAFAYVDVDHHDPTEQALEWIWPRLAPGGILLCDDYFEGAKGGASPPIDRLRAREKTSKVYPGRGEFVAELEVVHHENNQIALRKP